MSSSAFPPGTSVDSPSEPPEGGLQVAGALVGLLGVSRDLAPRGIDAEVLGDLISFDTDEELRFVGAETLVAVLSDPTLSTFPSPRTRERRMSDLPPDGRSSSPGRPSNSGGERRRAPRFLDKIVGCTLFDGVVLPVYRSGAGTCAIVCSTERDAARGGDRLPVEGAGPRTRTSSSEGDAFAEDAPRYERPVVDPRARIVIIGVSVRAVARWPLAAGGVRVGPTTVPFLEFAPSPLARTTMSFGDEPRSQR